MYLTTGQPKKIATALDYDRLPEGAPYQLIGGKLMLSPIPSFFHQNIVGELFAELHAFVRQYDLGKVVLSPMDVHLTVVDVYQPDLLFICKENLSQINPNDRIRIVPDLVVEVLSPSTEEQDYVRKRMIYGECGVAEYWIVDPAEHTVEVLLNDQGRFERASFVKEPSELTSPMFPGFSMSLQKLFQH
ncbi:MAG: Uma2 family endonuclease [Bacteroidota bacterium]|nr:Uma2 family endonuclease [Bacteroidota bacterium]